MEVLAQTRYRKIRQIGVGRGANSTVWEAQDLNLNGTVVVKEVARTHLQTMGVSNYFSEAQAMFASRHPDNVVPIHYACDCTGQDTIGIVMPFYKNGSLHDRIEKGPLSPKSAIQIGLKILNGLNNIHLAKHLHCDLKPSNVLFSDNDTPLVADFGQTQLLTGNGTAILPALYASGIPPEAFTTGIGTVETDIYHAGLMLYRMVNGNPHFDAQKPSSRLELEIKVLNGTFPDRNDFLPHVPAAFRAVIRRALEIDPAKRYPAVPDLQDALANVSISLDWETTIDPSGLTTWRAKRKEQPDLVVRLEQASNRWSVRIFTDNAGTLRAKDRTEWASSLTQRQAAAKLKQVFHSLA